MRAKRAMNMSTILRRLPALAVAASVVWTTGCGIETQVMGITADADIARPELMAKLAHGANLELSHVYFWANEPWQNLAMVATDEITNGRNNSGSYRRRATSQFHYRPDINYSQANEAGWVAAYAAERMYDVNVEYGTNPDSDPLIAHMHVNSALCMENLAETQCVACLGWGPEGGNLLKGSGDIYDTSNVIDSDSIMEMAVAWAEMAVPVAQAAIAEGRLNDLEPDWEHFIPENSLNAAYGIQARAWLWLEDFAKADEFAAKVPIDFVWNLYSHYDNSWVNDIHYWSNVYAMTTVYKSAIGTTFKDVDDPRIPWEICGEYKEGVTEGIYPNYGRSDSDYINLTADRPACQVYRTGSSARYNTYDDDLPNWVQSKYTSYHDEWPLITGLEMKLIRAEVALRNNNLAQFTTYINEVRDYYGLDPIEQPATAGALEYPNAEDDGWSILDREKLFTHWLDGRRWADFRRWDHPFWAEPHYKTTYEAALNLDLPRPFTCAPLPENQECDVNPGVRLTEWCVTLYAPGEGPGG
jgi:hypothetical protein